MYKFQPILKSLIWGGEKIAPYKGIATDQRNIGESWELSGVKDNESVVAEGPEAGTSLPELIARHGAALLGKANYGRFGEEFPLLIKFIDARQDLSIQVHPNDELAWERHKSKGKTEMWYVVSADKDAHLRSGFSKQVTPAEYEASVGDNTITDILADYKIAPGDVFFLPAGRVHSIGAGSFIAEIQQTSNITYRIYDFNRRDANGNTRELHTELAKGAIDYTVLPDYRTHYEPAQDTRVELVPLFHHVALRSDPPRDARPRVARLVRRGDLHRGLRHAHRRQRRSGSGAPGRNGPDSGFGPFARLHARRRHEDSDKLDRLIRLFGSTKKLRPAKMQAGVFRYGKPELLRLEPRLRVVGRSRTRLHHRSVDREIPLRRIHRRERSFHAVAHLVICRRVASGMLRRPEIRIADRRGVEVIIGYLRLVSRKSGRVIHTRQIIFRGNTGIIPDILGHGQPCEDISPDHNVRLVNVINRIVRHLDLKPGRLECLRPVPAVDQVVLQRRFGIK